MRIEACQSFNIFSALVPRLGSRTLSLSVGLAIASLNGLFWVGVTALTYWMLSHEQSLLVLGGVWVVAAYFSMFAVTGILNRSPDGAESSLEHVTACDDACEPDATQQQRHSKH